ncbi:hypothetical protein SAMN05216303_105120 [Rhodoferax sp. OV413]|uniref:hypothetical protein n=1 Tax=Rhodoferax sp. OV413 TaxID=1855285 RepID=UPI00089035AB|nr:hypothetical protein [Rhodoferax sp. OV413]SDP56121.1 hypothetical protein SAMN05216303_105120 [Rhodoferax sp. OV413]
MPFQSHKPHRPHDDVPGGPEPGSLPVEPDAGAPQPATPQDPGDGGLPDPAP